MTRAIEGTTLGGYICDARGCDRVGVYSPVVCVPYEGFPVEVRPPIIGFVDTQVCAEHWKDLREADVLGKPVRDAIEHVASQNWGRPAFKRAYIKPIVCHSHEYLQFQQTTGLVAPDDALVKGPPVQIP